MSRLMIYSILKTLKSARKADFILECSCGSRRYVFTIARNSNIQLEITEDSTGLVLLKEYSSVDKIVLPDEEYTITKIVETIRTQINTKYQETCHYCIDNVQRILPIFRVLSEQVVFLLKTDHGILKCYFISGKVFYVTIEDDVYTLVQTDLRRLFSSFTNSKIVAFEKLPIKYNYNSVLKQCATHCEERNLKWELLRNGVVAGGKW